VTSLADRLRGVLGPAKAGPYDESSGRPEGRPLRSNEDDAAEVLGGEWRESRGQRFLVVDRTYVPGYRHGCVTLADCLPPDSGIWPRLHLLGCGAGLSLSAEASAKADGPPGRLLFLDLETTGLAGGAGSYAFLVGCGWFDEGVFRLRQFFLANFGAERALLESVAELAAGCACVVTYNGKTFDLPLMETRFVLQRMTTPFADLPHIDMLHPARRMWRGAALHDEFTDATRVETGCSLTALERRLFDHHRQGDVPGYEIAARYFRYVRERDVCAMTGVLEHNRHDLLTLALLTSRAAQLLCEGLVAVRTAREALALGHYYERAKDWTSAEDCYRAASGIDGAVFPDVSETTADGLRSYATLLRRQRRHNEAASIWERLLHCLDTPERHRFEAARALAIHHEHRTKHLVAARTAAESLIGLSASRLNRCDAEIRLARLARKVGLTAERASRSVSAPLFATAVQRDGMH